MACCLIDSILCKMGIEYKFHRKGGVFKMKNVWKAALTGAAISTVLFTAPTAEAASYTVQKGDTLTKIAKAHNTSIQQLKQWNKLSGDQIYIKQNLVISSIGSVASINKVTAITVVEDKKVESQNATSKAEFYTVAKGDNLTKIAKKHNTTVAILKQWNNLKTDVIIVGQKLTIQQHATKDIAVESPTASNVEAVINFDETADDAIDKQLKNEKELAATVTKTNENLYTQAINIAQQSIGIPYKYGGTTIEGFDCSGFVNYVYNSVGIKMERKSSLMYFEQDTTKVAEPVPGDIVFFKNTFIPTISHMGIYIGNDQFIHAGSKGIAIGNVNEKYWAERFVAYKRFNSIQ